MRCFAFIKENIISVCYNIMHMWTFKSSKIWKLLCLTPQDRHWYGNILMNDTLYAYEWFFFYNWHELTFPSNTVFWSNTLFKYQTWMSSYPIPAILICNEQCRQTQEGEPAHIGLCLAIQRYDIAQYFEIGPRQNWFISQFLQQFSLCSTDSRGQICL